MAALIGGQAFLFALANVLVVLHLSWLWYIELVARRAATMFLLILVAVLIVQVVITDLNFLGLYLIVFLALAAVGLRLLRIDRRRQADAAAVMATSDEELTGEGSAVAHWAPEGSRHLLYRHAEHCKVLALPGSGALLLINGLAVGTTNRSADFYVLSLTLALMAIVVLVTSELLVEGQVERDKLHKAIWDRAQEDYSRSQDATRKDAENSEVEADTTIDTLTIALNRANSENETLQLDSENVRRELKDRDEQILNGGVCAARAHVLRAVESNS